MGVPQRGGSSDGKEAEIWCAEKGMKLLRTERLPSYQHVFTHVEWKLSCYGVWVSGQPEEFLWLDLEGLEQGRCPRHSGLAVRKPETPSVMAGLKIHAEKEAGWQLNQFIRL